MCLCREPQFGFGIRLLPCAEIYSQDEDNTTLVAFVLLSPEGDPGFYHAKMCYLGLKTPQVLHGMQVLAVDRDLGRNADTEVMEIREGHNYGQDIIV